jgi:galactonate dehydratase
MKITAVHIRRFFGMHRSWIFVEVETDEGISGISEVFIDQEKTLIAAIHELGESLIGQNATDIEYHWERIRRNTHWRGPVWYTALSGLEIAMWDLMGKWLGVPVYKLFGGPCHDSIRMYAHARPYAPPGSDEKPSYIAGALRQVERGYTALKVGPLGEAGAYRLLTTQGQTYRQPALYLSSRMLDDARQHIGSIRDAVGPDVDLAIDCGGRFRPADAIRLIHELEEFHLVFVEEPVAPEDVESMAMVSRAARVPIATGERLYTRFQYADLVTKRAVDIVQPDPINAGGMAETRRIAEMVAPFNMVLAPHNPNGPVALAQAVHICAAVSNFLMLETQGSEVLQPYESEAVVEPLQIVNGSVALPTKPGLGVELNVEAIQRRDRERPTDAFSGTSAKRRWSV